MDKTKAKRFGQHFLRDPQIIQKIIAAVDPGPQDHFVEIGPGKGALTVELLPLVKRLDVIEIDRELIPILQHKCRNLREGLNIHAEDVLRFDFSQLLINAADTTQKIRVIGNLPYNISTPTLFYVIKNINEIKDLHFMLQKQVADRLAACAGSKTYGRLSVMTQYHCYVDLLFEVDPQAFDPPPKVYSSFVKLIPRKRKVVAKNLTIFEDVVRTAFIQRRKTIHNSLKKFISNEGLENLGIDPKLRAEQLQVEDFIKVSDFTSILDKASTTY